MFAHERSLVKKYANRPFVLVGINTDASPMELKSNQEKAGLTWVSLWDGVGGPIARGCGFDSFPAFLLIDKQGIVRWRYVGVPPDGMIEKKIEEYLQTPTT